MSLSGGCQCGAVRFRIEGDVGRAIVCHCRMCQKATGAPFGVFVGVAASQLVWTRGEPKRFQSSSLAERGFCDACGTPLTYEWSEEQLGLTVCAFDEPGRIEPAVQMSMDSAIPWVADLAGLPAPSAELSGQFAARRAGLRSHQHPDHDTRCWKTGWGVEG